MRGYVNDQCDSNFAKIGQKIGDTYGPYGHMTADYQPAYSGPPTPAPEPTATQQRIAALKAAYPSDPPPLVVELIEALAGRDMATQAAVQYHAQLVALIANVNEMVERLAPVASQC